MRVYSAFPVSKVNELAAGGREVAQVAAQNQAAAAIAAAVSSTQSPTSASSPSSFPGAASSSIYDVPTAPTNVDALSTLVNLKTKSVQFCEYKSDSLNPTLKVDSLKSDKLRCVSTVDFSSDRDQVTVHRYKEVTSIG